MDDDPDTTRRTRSRSTSTASSASIRHNALAELEQFDHDDESYSQQQQQHSPTSDHDQQHSNQHQHDDEQVDDDEHREGEQGVDEGDIDYSRADDSSHTAEPPKPNAHDPPEHDEHQQEEQPEREQTEGEPEHEQQEEQERQQDAEEHAQQNASGGIDEREQVEDEREEEQAGEQEREQDASNASGVDVTMIYNPDASLLPPILRPAWQRASPERRNSHGQHIANSSTPRPDNRSRSRSPVKNQGFYHDRLGGDMFSPTKLQRMFNPPSPPSMDSPSTELTFDNPSQADEPPQSSNQAPEQEDEPSQRPESSPTSTRAPPPLSFRHGDTTSIDEGEVEAQLGSLNKPPPAFSTPPIQEPPQVLNTPDPQPAVITPSKTAPDVATPERSNAAATPEPGTLTTSRTATHERSDGQTPSLSGHSSNTGLPFAPLTPRKPMKLFARGTPMFVFRASTTPRPPNSASRSSQASGSGGPRLTVPRDSDSSTSVPQPPRFEIGTDARTPSEFVRKLQRLRSMGRVRASAQPHPRRSGIHPDRLGARRASHEVAEGALLEAEDEEEEEEEAAEEEVERENSATRSKSTTDIPSSSSPSPSVVRSRFLRRGDQLSTWQDTPRAPAGGDPDASPPTTEREHKRIKIGIEEPVAYGGGRGSSPRDYVSEAPSFMELIRQKGLGSDAMTTTTATARSASSGSGVGSGTASVSASLPPSSLGASGSGPMSRTHSASGSGPMLRTQSGGVDISEDEVDAAFGSTGRDQEYLPRAMSEQRRVQSALARPPPGRSPSKTVSFADLSPRRVAFSRTEAAAAAPTGPSPRKLLRQFSAASEVEWELAEEEEGEEQQQQSIFAEEEQHPEEPRQEEPDDLSFVVRQTAPPPLASPAGQIQALIERKTSAASTADPMRKSTLVHISPEEFNMPLEDLENVLGQGRMTFDRNAGKWVKNKSSGRSRAGSTSETAGGEERRSPATSRSLEIAQAIQHLAELTLTQDGSGLSGFGDTTALPLVKGADVGPSRRSDVGDTSALASVKGTDATPSRRFDVGDTTALVSVKGTDVAPSRRSDVGDSSAFAQAKGINVPPSRRSDVGDTTALAPVKGRNAPPSRWSDVGDTTALPSVKVTDATPSRRSDIGDASAFVLARETDAPPSEPSDIGDTSALVLVRETDSPPSLRSDIGDTSALVLVKGKDASQSHRQHGRDEGGGGGGHMTLATNASFSMARDRIVELIADVAPWEEHWEEMEEIDFSGRRVDTVLRLRDFCPALESVNLNRNELSYLSGLPIGLRTLKVAENRLSNMTLFDQLRHLETLDISGNHLTSLRNLEPLSRLRDLKANDNAITDVRGLIYLTSLRRLNLRGNRLTHFDAAALGASHLERLDLSRNSIQMIGSLYRLRDLRELNLDHNALTSIDLGPKMSRLRILRISFNPELSHLDVLPARKLNTLYVDGCSISKVDHIGALNGLENFSIRQQATGAVHWRADETRDAKRLFFSGNAFIGGLLGYKDSETDTEDASDASRSSDSQSTIPDAYPRKRGHSETSGKLRDPTSIPAQITLFTLVYLELSGCQLMAFPSELPSQLPNLRHLNLDHNLFTTLPGLQALTRLKRLSLVGCRVRSSQSIVRAVQGLPELLVLDTRMNPCTLGLYPPVIVVSPLAPAVHSGSAEGRAMPFVDTALPPIPNPEVAQPDVLPHKLRKEQREKQQERQQAEKSFFHKRSAALDPLEGSSAEESETDGPSSTMASTVTDNYDGNDAKAPSRKHKLERAAAAAAGIPVGAKLSSRSGSNKAAPANCTTASALFLASDVRFLKTLPLKFIQRRQAHRGLLALACPALVWLDGLVVEWAEVEVAQEFVEALRADREARHHGDDAGPGPSSRRPSRSGKQAEKESTPTATGTQTNFWEPRFHSLP